MSRQIATNPIEVSNPIIIANGEKARIPLPTSALGYGGVTGCARSDQNVTVALYQGKYNDQWIAGANETVAVTGSALSEANEAKGSSFGWAVVEAQAELVVSNESGSEATVWLLANLVGGV